jgi:hypothetical protein
MVTVSSRNAKASETGGRKTPAASCTFLAATLRDCWIEAAIMTSITRTAIS